MRRAHLQRGGDARQAAGSGERRAGDDRQGGSGDVYGGWSGGPQEREVRAETSVTVAYERIYEP